MISPFSTVAPTTIRGGISMTTVVTWAGIWASSTAWAVPNPCHWRRTGTGMAYMTSIRRSAAASSVRAGCGRVALSMMNTVTATASRSSETTVCVMTERRMFRFFLAMGGGP